MIGFSVLGERCDERSRQAATGLPGARFALAERTSLIARAVSGGGFTGPRARSARLRGLVSFGCGLLLVVPRAGSAGRGRSMVGWASPSSQGRLGLRRPGPGTGPSPRRQRARPSATSPLSSVAWSLGAARRLLSQGGHRALLGARPRRAASGLDRVVFALADLVFRGVA